MSKVAFRLKPMFALVIICAAGLTWFGNLMQQRATSRLPDVRITSGVTKPNLAMELVRSRQDVVDVLGEPGAPGGNSRRVAMRDIQCMDLPFIACYVCLFCITGLQMKAMPGSFKRALGYSVIVLIIAAGLFDVLEDWSILRVSWLDAAHLAPGFTRTFALCKWSLIFVTLILVSAWLSTWPRSDLLHWLPAVIAAGCLLVCGLLGMVGVVASDRVIQMASTFSAVAIGVLLVPLLMYVYGDAPMVVTGKGTPPAHF